jgi:hypothetical protein
MVEWSKLAPAGQLPDLPGEMKVVAPTNSLMKLQSFNDSAP